MRALLVGGGDPELASVLSARGHALALASGAEQALQALVSGPTPDLVVVAAPTAGVEAIRAVRSHVRGENAALVAIVPEEACERALDAGADAALPLPTPPAHLVAAIAGAERAAVRRGASRDGRCVDTELYFARNPYPMWFFDVETLAFLAVNEAAIQKYGWSRDEFLRMTIKDIRPPEDVPRLMEVTRRVARGLDRSGVWQHRSKDGRSFHVEIISYPVTYAGRACRLILAHDVSDWVRAEKKLDVLRAQVVAADRLAAIGTLAAGVAHEVSGPLSFVLTNLAFVEGRLRELGGAEAASLREALADALEGARRVQQIAADLKGFSRVGDQEPGPVDLPSVVAGALALAASELRHRARTVIDVAGAPSPLGQDGKLRQVLLNLLVNAAHAIPEGAPERHEVSVTARAEGDRVVVEVSDTGPGVPEELRTDIFEPFFTTKPVGQGTGLGLWVCRRTVEELGGEIAVGDRPGGGATFRVSLPTARGPSAAPRGGGASALR
jgi:PAS domain S-box-containing protein